MSLLKNKTNISEFLRRLKFYGLGFGLGLIMVMILFKDRTICKMPSTLKLEELRKQSRNLEGHPEYWTNCQIIEKDISELFQVGKINYSKSDVQARPCPIYAIEGFNTDGKHLRIMVADCDTITKIISVCNFEIKDNSCGCK